MKRRYKPTFVLNCCPHIRTNTVMVIFSDMTKRAKKEQTRTQVLFARVVFNRSNRTYDYICEISDAAIGDKVVVIASGKEKEAEIVHLFRNALCDMPLPVKRYKGFSEKRLIPPTHPLTDSLDSSS